MAFWTSEINCCDMVRVTNLLTMIPPQPLTLLHSASRVNLPNRILHELNVALWH